VRKFKGRDFNYSGTLKNLTDQGRKKKSDTITRIKEKKKPGFKKTINKMKQESNQGGGGKEAEVIRKKQRSSRINRIEGGGEISV